MPIRNYGRQIGPRIHTHRAAHVTDTAIRLCGWCFRPLPDSASAAVQYCPKRNCTRMASQYLGPDARPFSGRVVVGPFSRLAADYFRRLLELRGGASR